MDKTRRADIISTLAQVAVIYQEKGLAGLREHTGLLYDNYQGLKEKIGHFRLIWTGESLVRKIKGSYLFVMWDPMITSIIIHKNF